MSSRDCEFDDLDSFLRNLSIEQFVTWERLENAIPHDLHYLPENETKGFIHRRYPYYELVFFRQTFAAVWLVALQIWVVRVDSSREGYDRTMVQIYNQYGINL